MHPDIPTYLTIMGAAILGVGFAIWKFRKPESKLAFPLAIGVIVISIASAVLHASQTDFVFALIGNRIVKGIVPLAFGLGLLIGCIAMVTCASYCIANLYFRALLARNQK